MAASHSILSTVNLHELFEYIDGELFWKIPAGGQGCIKAGSKAGVTHKNGYKSVRVKNVMLKQHRVIYMMFHGSIPKTIDHIDGNPSNNRIENLREATASQNMRNSRKQTRNTSGVKGVSWHRSKNKWIASCGLNGKLIHIGYFEEINDASDAVMKFRKEHHKEFANCG